jgi:UDP-2,3-diacylglucosamine pyrophosphatase LpxH
LGIWKNKLHDCQTAMANKDKNTLNKDCNLIEEIKVVNKCDMIIMGHTHVDDIKEGLCNSGTWANSTPSYLRILPDGTIDLYRWQAMNAYEGKGVLRKRFNATTREISQVEPFKHQRM